MVPDVTLQMFLKVPEALLADRSAKATYGGFAHLHFRCDTCGRFKRKFRQGATHVAGNRLVRFTTIPHGIGEKGLYWQGQL